MIRKVTHKKWLFLTRVFIMSTHQITGRNVAGNRFGFFAVKCGRHFCTMELF